METSRTQNEPNPEVEAEAPEADAPEAEVRRPPARQGKLSLLVEFTQFLRQEGKWWLTPIIVILVLLGALLIYAEGSVLVPFIYTLF